VKRYRANVSAGRRIARAPWDATIVNFMIATNYLDPAEAGNPRAVGEAYYAMVRDAAKNFP
jgi:hypothetical protein